MIFELTKIIILPFLGTALGAMCVFFMKKGLGIGAQMALNGFAGGIMIAASVWSLLIPAMDASASMGKLAFLPAACGLFLGILFLFILDKAVPHIHMNEQSEGPKSTLKKQTMLFFAVTLHNIPEGIALGVAIASILNTGGGALALGAPLALAIGIAIQNFPEGAIISMPLRANGMSKSKSCLYGVLSGLPEPVFTVITVLISELLTPIFPVLLAFAAGAMIYVVVEELIPEMTNSDHKGADIGTVMFALGFVIMMSLDVALS